jgi:hypothetical protein
MPGAPGHTPDTARTGWPSYLRRASGLGSARNSAERPLDPVPCRHHTRDRGQMDTTRGRDQQASPSDQDCLSGRQHPLSLAAFLDRRGRPKLH